MEHHDGEDFHGMDGGSLPDPASRPWRHPSELGGHAHGEHPAEIGSADIVGDGSAVNPDRFGRPQPMWSAALAGTALVGTVVMVVGLTVANQSPSADDALAYGHITTTAPSPTMLDGDSAGSDSADSADSTTGTSGTLGTDDESGVDLSEALAAGALAGGSDPNLLSSQRTPAESGSHTTLGSGPVGAVRVTDEPVPALILVAERPGQAPVELGPTTLVRVGANGADVVVGFTTSEVDGLGDEASLNLATGNGPVVVSTVGQDPLSALTVVRVTDGGSIDLTDLIARADTGSTVTVGEQVCIHREEVVCGTVVETDARADTEGGTRLFELVQTTIVDQSVETGTGLVDADGALVGIVIDTDSALVTAMPVAAAQSIAHQLLAGGSVARGWLGLEAITSQGRAEVVGVVEDGPCRGFLEEGDAILSIDGESIDDADQLVSVVWGLTPGHEVSVIVDRAGQVHQFTIPVDLLDVDR